MGYRIYDRFPDGEEDSGAGGKDKIDSG